MVSNSCSSPPRHRGYVRPSPETAIRVREFIARWGERLAARAWGLDRVTVIRAAAGVQLQGLALSVIEEGLDMPEEDLLAFERAEKERPRPRSTSAAP